MNKTGPVCFFAIFLTGCADERIIKQSHSFASQISALAQQEVIDNLDETITNEYRIPRRTTFGKGGLTFSDSGGLSIALPLHLFNKNPGTATANSGASSDSYQLSIVPEVGGPTLQALRQVYQAAIYPDRYKKIAIPLSQYIGAPLHWLYWKKIDGTPSENEPPDRNAVRVGVGSNYEIWTSAPEAFSTFLLLTYGDSPQADRVKSQPTLLPDHSLPEKPNTGGTTLRGLKIKRQESGSLGKSLKNRVSGVPLILMKDAPVIYIAPSSMRFGTVLDNLSIPKSAPTPNSDILPLPGR